MGNNTDDYDVIESTDCDELQDMAFSLWKIEKAGLARSNNANSCFL